MVLRSEDLMLGDWVQGYLPDTSLKVVGIPSEYRLAVVTSDRTYMELSIDDCQPIPLTPEILEKNGFISRGSGWYIPNTPRLDMGILGFGIDDGCGTGFSQMPNGDFVFFSKYVHEIQHCLRMVHIKKEIVL